MSGFRLTALILGLVFPLAAAADEPKPIPGIGPKGKIVKLHSGFRFTEGPAADAEGNVYFTDIPNNRILVAATDGKLSTFLEDSKGCNGLMFDGKGRIIACQGGAGRIIAIDVKTKKIDIVADTYDGQRFDRPNDLVVDRSGGVYFTDPGKRSVYYVAAGGKVTRLIDDLPRPNGVILSPDEKTLYVLPSGSPDVMAYPVESGGKIGTGKAVCQLEQPAAGMRRGGDGLTVDTKGNLYLTQPALSAIQVVSPEGKTLGLIKFPEAPANCTFGGKEMKTLYVTARTSLYTVEMEATGHRFGGPRRPAPPPRDEQVQKMIDELDRACRERTIYMVGPEKAARLAELVREHRPTKVVECGTAIGYSGLWIARELKALKSGKLITIEIDEKTAREAQENFRKAGVAEYVEVKIGDARKVVQEIPGPIDFVFIDCNGPNYHPCLIGLEDRLADGAVIVADNAGISAGGMADYLERVRKRYQSRTEWFDIDLPWGKRDAMEITVFRRSK
jgi:gluconolactonase